MRDLESIDQDSLTPDASIRDFQKPSEPSTPIDKGIQSDLRGIAELEQESSTSPTLTTMVPKQPVLPEYPGTKFSSESFTRRFQPDWYKKYPWLSYEVEKDVCVCFACIEFGKDASFVFKNWKKPSKLTKHSQSENHVSCMTKWLQFKAMERKNSSVLQQLSSAHQEQVTINRKYLQVIIECLIFTAMQNEICPGLTLIRCTRISISVTKCPLALLPNFNITCVSEYRQFMSQSVPQMLLFK